MRRVAILSGPSGTGKSTFGRALAERLGVPYVETDSLVHGPDWVQVDPEVLRALLDPTLALDGWVIDGTYGRLIGNHIIDRADTLVWLDLPIRVWFPRLIRRTVRRLVRREVLWNGNRESWRTAFVGREGLVVWAFRSHWKARRRYPALFAGHPVVRLRSPREVEAVLASAQSLGPGDAGKTSDQGSPPSGADAHGSVISTLAGARDRSMVIAGARSP